MKRFSRTFLALFVLAVPMLSYGIDPITGALSVCAGNTTTLANATGGGTWSSSTVATATIGSSSGLVSGVAAGTATITYTFPTTGFVTSVVTVNAVPSAIAGNAAFCNTFSTTLSDTVMGGIWTSTSPRVTVGSATGLVTGVSTGTALITYTLAGGCRVFRMVTVNLQPASITGTMNVCVGSTRTLSNAVSGGTWTSSNASAMFGTTSVGIVTGVSADTTVVKYTLSDGCFSSVIFTVNPAPGPISGTFLLCAGATTTLADTSLPGGTWSSSNITVAAMGTSSGIFHANSAGTATITYKTTGNCISTKVVTVNASPATITGTFSVCSGGTTQLNNSVPLGSWISSDTNTAVLVTPTGLVGGVAAGTVAVTYMLTNGCYRTAILTVNALPDTISGASQVCTSRTINLTSLPVGGTWSCSNTAIAAIGSITGVATGISAGTAVVTYRLATGCKRTHSITVNTTPAAISGAMVLCQGLTTSLTTASVGGSWVSSSTGVAIVASAAGVVTGVTGGTVTLSYVDVASGCNTTATLTVNPSPATISGGATVCAGNTVALSITSTGGTWSSSATGVLTVGSTSGIVTGITAGTATVTYRLPTGCINTRVMTVNPMPFAGAVTGSGVVCQTGTTNLTPSITGGTWSSLHGMVSISTGGIVTGIYGGMDTIRYGVTGGCGVGYVYYPITINPLPDTADVLGNPNICLGLTSSLYSSLTGGTWSNGSTTAAVVSGTGVVTGIALGTAIISYTRSNSCGLSIGSVVVTVHALVNPGTINGRDTTCMGDSIALHPTVSGGSWASTAPWIASINDTGLVIGSFPGTVSILYIVSNVCSTDTAIHGLYVNMPGDCATGIHTPPTANTSGLQTYPNPTNGLVNIETPVAGNITLYSMEGREVARYDIRGNTAQIALPNSLANGVYVCRFTGTDGGVVMTRIVYEH